MDLRKKGEKTYCDGGSSGRALVELWCEEVDAAADSKAEAEFEDDGGARVRGRREEEEEMNG